MKKNLVLALISFIILAACKKDKEEISLIGKWTIENSIEKEYQNNMIVNTYTEPGNGATMDFQNNGHIIITYPGYSNDTLTYVMKPDSKVEIDGDIFEIKNLSKAAVSLYMRQDYSQGEYDEIFMNLKR